jgi:hypothetical protein
VTKTIIASNFYQRSYSYDLTEEEGVFCRDRFNPFYTPREMLLRGIMGGSYFYSSFTEYPESWFKDIPLSPHYDEKLNRFKVKSGLSIQSWREAGWIHEEDPRGWIEWYFRYYAGRRSEDDNRQIGRWRAMARHRGRLLSQIRQGSESYLNDDFGAVTRQVLLHWSWNPFPEVEIEIPR